jgi:tetratricopeptide (TPR) repeat protein
MKKFEPVLYVVAALLLVLATAGFLHLYNTGKQETEQKAVAALDRGIALFHEKKYAESVEVLQGIEEGLIQDWHLPYYTATAQVMLKDYEPAALKLEEALLLNPQETLIMFELGVVYYKLGKLSLSKAYFASVVEIDPTHEEARGLMEVMAGLERNQPGTTQQTEPMDDNTGDKNH